MDPDQQPQPDQQDLDNKDYSFPGTEPAAGPVNTGLSMLGMVTKVPLVGSALNTVEALGDAGAAIYHGHEAKNDYANGDVGAGGAEIDKAETDENEMVGHFINAIPLVGFARAWM